jgi:CPA2 family monovalent cation:H+ antiporter-2
VQRAFRRRKEDLDAARRKEAAQAASNKTFSPEELELAERFPLFASLTPEQREVLVLHFKPRTTRPAKESSAQERELIPFISSPRAARRFQWLARTIKLGPGDFLAKWR